MTCAPSEGRPPESRCQGKRIFSFSNYVAVIGRTKRRPKRPPASQSALPAAPLLSGRELDDGVTKPVFTTHFVTITAPVAASPVVEPPAMPGMLRKSRAFVLRYYKFESISLQR